MRLMDKAGFDVDNFMLEVQKGDIVGASVEWRVGMLITPDTLNNDVWELGGTYNFPELAIPIYLWSTNALDTQQILVSGLDENWDIQETIITLNGTTPVDTNLTWMRSCRIVNVGSIDLVGICYASRVSGSIAQANVMGAISVGNNGSLSAICSIAAGFTGYMFQGSLSSGKGKEVMFSFRTRANGRVFVTGEMVGLYEGTIERFRPFLPIPEKSDVKIVAKADLAGTAVHASFGILLLDNAIYGED